MTKTLNQIFFFLHQNQNIFFSNIGNQNISLEKKHNPPFKLNGRSLSRMNTVNDINYTCYNFGSKSSQRILKFCYFSCLYDKGFNGDCGRLVSGV